jgi:hypothetical protein
MKVKWQMYEKVYIIYGKHCPSIRNRGKQLYKRIVKIAEVVAFRIVFFGYFSLRDMPQCSYSELKILSKFTCSSAFFVLYYKNRYLGSIWRLLFWIVLISMEYQNNVSILVY